MRVIFCGTRSNGTLVRFAYYSRQFLRHCGQPRQLGEKQVACPYLRVRGCRRAQTHLHSIRGRTSIAGWVLGDRPRSCMSSRMRWRKGVMTIPPVRGERSPTGSNVTSHYVPRIEERMMGEDGNWRACFPARSASFMCHLSPGCGRRGLSSLAYCCPNFFVQRRTVS